MSDISYMGKIIIVGRPNVGKSSLFNRIISRRRALVSDYPGTTIDYIESYIDISGRKFSVVDTGGWTPPERHNRDKNHGIKGIAPAVKERMRRFVEKLLSEGARAKNIAVIFLTDAKDGLNPLDTAFADYLREKRLKDYVILAVNKADTDERESTAAGEFYRVGFGEPHPVSAQNGRNVDELLEKAANLILKNCTPAASAQNIQADETHIPRIMILGRPNAGKSTLINRLAGYERCIVDKTPGTTRESINTIVSTRDGKKVELIDTPGIARARKFKNTSSGAPLDYLSFVSVKKHIPSVDVAVLLVDALEGITKADESLAGMIAEEGLSAVVGFNKWDAVPSEKREKYFKLLMNEFKSRFNFLSYARFTVLSALTGSGVEKNLLPAVFSAYESYNIKPDEKKISSTIKDAVLSRPIISPSGRRLAFTKIISSSARPPALKIAVNEPSMLHFSYKRYLLNAIREKHPEFAEGNGAPFLLTFAKDTRI